MSSVQEEGPTPSYCHPSSETSWLHVTKALVENSVLPLSFTNATQKPLIFLEILKTISSFF